MGKPEQGSNYTAAVFAGFDQLPMMAATMEGPELRVTAINAVLRSMVDHDVVGETIEEAVPELAGQLIVDHVREVYATGVPFAGSSWRLESPGPDGELLERFLDLSWTPLRRSDGTIHGILATGLDVTDAVRARQAIDAETAGVQARNEHARDTVTMFQQALLPSTLPVLPGLDLSARYLLAEVHTSAGGDWFDTLVFDDGRVAPWPVTSSATVYRPRR